MPDSWNGSISTAHVNAQFHSFFGTATICEMHGVASLSGTFSMISCFIKELISCSPCFFNIKRDSTCWLDCRVNM